MAKKSLVVVVAPGEKVDLSKVELPQGMKLGEPEVIVAKDGSGNPVSVAILSLAEQIEQAVRRGDGVFIPFISGFARR